jgi:hypothetical protein
MPAVKAQKKSLKVSKKPATKPVKKQVKKQGRKAPKKVLKAAPSQKKPPVRKDETTIKLGPHHVERHLVIGGVQIRPAPAQHQIPTARVHHMTTRHH